MDLFGMDLAQILLTIANFAFWGAIIIGFVVFADKNPYLPRKYYKVKLENKDGKELRDCKAWKIKKKKVDYFKISLRAFPGFKDVDMDISVMESLNSKGEMVLIESVPDLYDASNYRPKEVPLTQRDRFISDVVTDVLTPLCIVNYKDGEETKQGVNRNILDLYTLKVKEALNKNSRIEDLNRSAAVRERINKVRQEEERTGGGDWVAKYAPMIIMIFVCLFAYLILDNLGKLFQSTMAQQNAVMEHGYSQVIQQCGGVYHPMYANASNTTTPQGGVNIPFITK